MKELWWRARYAFWFWWDACFWYDLRSPLHAAEATDYYADDEPRDSVATEISYFEP